MPPALFLLGWLLASTSHANEFIKAVAAGPGPCNPAEVGGVAAAVLTNSAVALWLSGAQLPRALALLPPPALHAGAPAFWSTAFGVAVTDSLVRCSGTLPRLMIAARAALQRGSGGSAAVAAVAAAAAARGGGGGTRRGPGAAAADATEARAAAAGSDVGIVGASCSGCAAGAAAGGCGGNDSSSAGADARRRSCDGRAGGGGGGSEGGRAQGGCVAALRARRTWSSPLPAIDPSAAVAGAAAAGAAPPPPTVGTPALHLAASTVRGSAPAAGAARHQASSSGASPPPPRKGAAAARRAERLAAVYDGLLDTYRAALPAPVWVAFLRAATPNALLGTLLAGTYLVIKARGTAARGRALLLATRLALRGGALHGRYVKPGEAAPDGQPYGCAICYADECVMPVRLDCSHVFCEDCIAEWCRAARGPTCPCCRARVRSGVGPSLGGTGRGAALPRLF
jgi:hypothetical protein